ncbi:MAG: hypothetical protein JEZ11_08905 [Desulfobacterales bacterium]|nr:hypothetical protein [Desulfobacterales bacterium]
MSHWPDVLQLVEADHPQPVKTMATAIRQIFIGVRDDDFICPPFSDVVSKTIQPKGLDRAGAASRRNVVAMAAGADWYGGNVGEVLEIVFDLSGNSSRLSTACQREVASERSVVRGGYHLRNQTISSRSGGVNRFNRGRQFEK